MNTQFIRPLRPNEKSASNQGVFEKFMNSLSDTVNKDKLYGTLDVLNLHRKLTDLYDFERAYRSNCTVEQILGDKLKYKVVWRGTRKIPSKFVELKDISMLFCNEVTCLPTGLGEMEELEVLECNSVQKMPQMKMKNLEILKCNKAVGILEMFSKKIEHLECDSVNELYLDNGYYRLNTLIANNATHINILNHKSNTLIKLEINSFNPIIHQFDMGNLKWFKCNALSDLRIGYNMKRLEYLECHSVKNLTLSTTESLKVLLCNGVSLVDERAENLKVLVANSATAISLESDELVTLEANCLKFFSNIKNMRTLINLYCDSLTKLGPEIGYFCNLSTLCVNSVEKLPEELSDLINLRVLEANSAESIPNIPRLLYLKCPRNVYNSYSGVVLSQPREKSKDRNLVYL
eukprot:Pgem_evm1s418